jgi:uncharacterized protein YqgV (UPF0045/DUF77 family)
VGFSDVLGVSIALEVNTALSAQNIEDAVKDVENKLKNSKIEFNPDSIHLINIDNDNIEVGVRDLNNTLYKLSSTIKNLQDKGGFDVKISTESFDKTETKINNFANKLTKLQSRISNLDLSIVSSDDVDNLISDFVKLDDELKGIKNTETSMSTSMQNDLSESLSKIEANIVKQEQLVTTTLIISKTFIEYNVRRVLFLQNIRPSPHIPKAG